MVHIIVCELTKNVVAKQTQWRCIIYIIFIISKNLGVNRNALNILIIKHTQAISPCMESMTNCYNKIHAGISSLPYRCNIIIQIAYAPMYNDNIDTTDHVGYYLCNGHEPPMANYNIHAVGKRWLKVNFLHILNILQFHWREITVTTMLMYFIK